MSVIAGVWSFDGCLAADSLCRSMLNALSLYGKEGQAQYTTTGFAMGRCFLRLLPEDDFDQQPLSVTGLTLVADARLDNRAELAAKLGIASATLAGMADSAVLLAAWQKWGDACPEYLSGAFSFAVWEAADQRLFLARDHTGERPLYYSFDTQGFAFASMPKGLHPVPFARAEVDVDYVARYLTLAHLSVEQTIFRRIQRLPAGSAMSVSQGKTRIWRYWRTDRLADLRLGSAEEYLACFRERFDRGVKARLRTRGKVGALLSGGLDSGSVAATAAGILAAEGRGLACFTAVPGAGFQGSGGATHFGDEGAAAAEVAALYGNVRHFCVDSSAISFLDILDQHNDLYDHPCFGPNNEVWLHAIMQRAQADGISVMLNGNCGNATFSSYGMQALTAWFQAGEWATLLRVGWQLRRAGNSSVRAILRQGLGPALPFWLRTKVDPHMRGFSLDYSMLRPELARQMDLERIAFHDMNQVGSDGRGTLRSLLAYGDVSDTAISGQGGWGVDFRDPTFDRWVVEFCLTAPLEEFLRGGEQRSLVRRAMAGRLPESTLKQSRRGLQSADWYVNMGKVRERMLEQVEKLAGSELVRSVIDLERMRSLIENWPTSGFDRPEVMRTHHIALTRGFSVGMFLMRYDGVVSGHDFSRCGTKSYR